MAEGPPPHGLPTHRLPPYVAYDYAIHVEGGIVQCLWCGHASNRVEYLQHAEDCPKRRREEE